MSAWADGQFVGDAREEKLLTGFGSEDRAALLFRTTSLGVHEAVRAKAEVLHDLIIAQTRWQHRSFFPLSTTNTFHKHEPLPVQPNRCRAQSEGVLGEHRKKRVLMFPSATSMVVASTIFNVKNGRLNKSDQRLRGDSVIRKRPSVALRTDRTVLSVRESPRTSNRLLSEKIIRLGNG